MSKRSYCNLGPISLNFTVEVPVPLRVISESLSRFLSKCYKLGRTFCRSRAGNEPGTKLLCQVSVIFNGPWRELILPFECCFAQAAKHLHMRVSLFFHRVMAWSQAWTWWARSDFPSYMGYFGMVNFHGGSALTIRAVNGDCLSFPKAFLARSLAVTTSFFLWFSTAFSISCMRSSFDLWWVFG